MADRAGAGRRKALRAAVVRMQLEAEAKAPPLTIESFREVREKAVQDALMFAAASIARPQGGWRFEVSDEALRDVVGHLFDAMSVVRMLPVTRDPEHAAAVDQVRRHMAAVEDAAFQRFLSGVRK